MDFTPTTILSVATFIGAAIFITAQWINGKRIANTATLTDASATVRILNDRIDAQDELIKEIKADADEAWEKVIRLEEQLRLKDETIKNYVEILQNRDPKLYTILDEVKSLMHEVAALLKERTTEVSIKSNTNSTTNSVVKTL